MVSTRCTTLITMASPNGSSSGLRPSIGAQATRPPEPRAPTAMARPSTVPARVSARSTGTAGSSAWAASTYQASSGPESSARKMPCSVQARTKIPKLGASRNTTAATMASAPATISTGRRPSASASPPVGSSRASITNPWAAMATADLADAQPPLEHEQRDQADDQPDREPPGGREQQQGPLRRGGGDGPAGHRPASSDSGTTSGSGATSGSSGRAKTLTETRRPRGSSSAEGAVLGQQGVQPLVQLVHLLRGDVDEGVVQAEHVDPLRAASSASRPASVRPSRRTGGRSRAAATPGRSRCPRRRGRRSWSRSGSRSRPATAAACPPPHRCR